MLDRLRTRAVWMAVGLIFGGGALATAGSGFSVGDVSDPAPVTSDDPADEPKDEAKDEAKDAAKDARKEDKASVSGSRERKQNHGYFVSRAAKCEPVSDGETSFTPPADCEGEAKGAYVSEVAHSDLGKKDKP